MCLCVCVSVCVCVCVCVSMCLTFLLFLYLLIISINRNRENKISEMESEISALKDREINGELELEILNSIQYFSQNALGLESNDVSKNDGMDTSRIGIGRTYDVMARTSQGRPFYISSASIPSSVSSSLSPTFCEKRDMINLYNDDDVNEEKDNDDEEKEEERDDHILKRKFNKNKTKVELENKNANDAENNKNENSSISGYGYDAECFDLTSALCGFRISKSRDLIEGVGEREGGRVEEREGGRDGERVRKWERTREKEGEGEKNMLIENVGNRIDSSTKNDKNRMFSVSRNILPSNVHVAHTHDARTAYIFSGSTYTTQSVVNLVKNIDVNNDDCENEQNSTARKLKLTLKLSGFSSPSSSDETSIGKLTPSRFSDFSSDLECLSKKLDALSHSNIR